MAPPKNRRLGFSRRAHFGLFLGYVVAIGAALVAVAGAAKKLAHAGVQVLHVQGGRNDPFEVPSDLPVIEVADVRAGCCAATDLADRRGRPRQRQLPG